MNIETKTVELGILTASEGMVLTNGEAFSSVGGQVYLGINDNPDNWYEITEEEANIQKEAIRIAETESETDEVQE